jgi:hypothetical protein
MSHDADDPEATWPDARERLLALIAGYLGGTIEVEAFCVAFDQLYNLHLDHATLRAEEDEAFGRIFERVVWYSPFPDERAQIPGYLGPEDIRATVQKESSVLERSARSRRP